MQTLTIRNSTGLVIDFVAGLDEEHTLKPGEEVTVELEDGDIMYLDQAVKPE